MITKKFAILLTILAFTVLSQPFTASAVVNWTKDDANNPVLEPGSPGTWDEAQVFDPYVIMETASSYKMWFAGYSSDNGDQIGYATSTDGIDWTKYGSAPVLPVGSENEWDGAQVSSPYVIFDGGVYKMWYCAESNPGVITEWGVAQIGYATSADGIDWTKYDDPGTTEAPCAESDPVLSPGDPGEWDSEWVDSSSVLFDGSTYHMWYIGVSGGYNNFGVGYATSPDGVNWTKHGPVLWAWEGSWDEKLENIRVIRDATKSGIYRMWYGGADAEAHRIGYAYSVDGINWRKYHGNPVMDVGGPGDFDEDGLIPGTVMQDASIYRMWYTGGVELGEDLLELSIGYAAAPVYQGTHLAINKACVATFNTPDGLGILLGVVPEGPGPLDISELKVTLPDSSVFLCNDWNITNIMGSQEDYWFFTEMDPVPSGTYTFWVRTNNGLTDSYALDLAPQTINVPQDGSGPNQLDRHIVVDDTRCDNESYIGATTPTFKWKPSEGEQYYYHVEVWDWRYSAIWYLSNKILGSTYVGGYLSETVPEGILKPNTPSYWKVVVSDSSTHYGAGNAAVSDWYAFYTGTRDETPPYDFLAFADLSSVRHFGGPGAWFVASVANLAPWDINTVNDKFRVEYESGATFYEFNLDWDAWPSSPYDFFYAGWVPGIPQDQISPGHKFYVSDDIGNSDSIVVPFFDVPDLPRVTKEDMSPSENAYLPGTEPTLTWKSKGSQYKYRVTVHDWNENRLAFETDLIDGAPEGEVMSVDVPAGSLAEYSPYHWFVQVLDGYTNTMVHSQWITFQTGREGEFTCDINGDGEITPQDALCAFQKYLGICPTACGPCNEIYCDVNQDGDCTPADALEIFKEYLGLPSVCSQ